MKKLVIILLAYVLVGTVQNAKILGIFPAPIRSHYILSSTLMNALAEKGHDVTMISPFVQKNPPTNGTYRDIILTGTLQEIQGLMEQVDLYQIGSENLFLKPFTLSNGLSFLSQDVLNHSNVQKLIHSNETFDVVIVEQYCNEAQNVLASLFNASLVAFTTIGTSDRVNYLVGNPSPLSYIPEFFLMYSSDMTFCERLINALIHFLIQVFKTFYLLPKQEEILRKYVTNSPDLYDILYNTSLVLLNSHPSFSQPVPLVPNMIEIGGFHVKPSKKLPKDLQEFLDTANDGVIYFSMGSVLKSKQLPQEKREAFLKTFSKLKQKVLWKWEDNKLPGKPDNVKIVKWLPQQDILAHPNIKLFITHGGLLSTIETIYHGVPILAIPVISDQRTNAAKAVTYGFALQLDLFDITEEKLTNTVNELLDNPKYRETAKLRSKIFHDQQVKPLDRAIYWIEYVSRHKGANHLKIAGLRFPWYKYYLLDVMALGILIVIAINAILFLIIKKLFFGEKQKLKTH